MRNKVLEPLRLEGISVVLDEVQPKYFSYVIKWRNNKELNRYLNQPYVLTMENQTRWYEDIYLKDSSQGFMIIIDKSTNIPFGTVGWTDMNTEMRECILGRVILGNSELSGTPAFIESIFLFGDYIYSLVDIAYVHVGVQNKKALRLNKGLGFQINNGIIRYPHELTVNGDEQRQQIEMYRTKKMYQVVRKKLFEDIHDLLF